MPPVNISSSGVGLPAAVIRSGISAVQSFVLHPKFVSNDLLTVECLEELKVNLPVGHQFLARTPLSILSWISVVMLGQRFLRVCFAVTPPTTLVRLRGGDLGWLVGDHPVVCRLVLRLLLRLFLRLRRPNQCRPLRVRRCKRRERRRRKDPVKRNLVDLFETAR